MLFDTLGFGKSMDDMPFLLMPGVLSFAWGAVIHLLAEGLGVELDDIRETLRARAAPETFDIAAGTIEAGTAAATAVRDPGHRRRRARASSSST